MVLRPSAALISTLMLAPSVALAAPAEGDRPEVQRPGDAPAEGDTPSEADDEAAGDDAEAPEGEAAEAPEGEGDAAAEEAGEKAEAPAEAPAATDADDPRAEAEAATHEPTGAPSDTTNQPAGEDEEKLAGLLVSDEPEPARARVRTQPSTQNRVDRNERLRNYYKSIYRPPHNPSRVYFAARGGYALSGVTESSGGGRMGWAQVEAGQTWNHVGWAIGPTIYAGSLTFGDVGVEKFGGLLIGGGPSVGLGRLSLLGRGYLDFRLGYNFFYAPVSSTRPELADPPDGAPHGPKAQIDVGLLLHDSESRRFRHGLGASIGYQGLFHSLAGEYPVVNSFSIGVSYFFG